MSMTFASFVLEKSFIPFSVDLIYSSIFALVAGPALFEAMLETTSIYSICFETLEIALIIGKLACSSNYYIYRNNNLIGKHVFAFKKKD